MPGLIDTDDMRTAGCDDGLDDIEDILVPELINNTRNSNRPNVVPRARKSRVKKNGGENKKQKSSSNVSVGETAQHLHWDSYVPGLYISNI